MRRSIRPCLLATTLLAAMLGLPALAEAEVSPPWDPFFAPPAVVADFGPAARPFGVAAGDYDSDGTLDLVAATLSPEAWAAKCWQNYDPGDIPGDPSYEPCGTGEGTADQTLTLPGGKATVLPSSGGWSSSPWVRKGGAR